MLPFTATSAPYRRRTKMEHDVRDTELTIVSGRGNVHTKTKRRPRVTDGVKHPPVKIIKQGEVTDG